MPRPRHEEEAAQLREADRILRHGFERPVERAPIWETILGLIFLVVLVGAAFGIGRHWNG